MKLCSDCLHCRRTIEEWGAASIPMPFSDWRCLHPAHSKHRDAPALSLNRGPTDPRRLQPTMADGFCLHHVHWTEDPFLEAKAIRWEVRQGLRPAPESPDGSSGE